MTPTEQDKELREKLVETILSILGITDRTSGNRPEQIATLEQEIAAYITADRKRVALEARIDALDTIHKRLAASDLNTKHYKIISKMLIESKEGYREAMKQEEVK